LCTDEPVPSNAPDPILSLSQSMASRVGQAFANVVGVDTIQRGPAGGVVGVSSALTDLESGQIDAVVLGGVHTDYDPARIQQLCHSKRLFSTENVDALIPGEQAAFVVLVRPALATQIAFAPMLSILEVASGFERARPDNDESAFTAAGMTTAALRQALRSLTEAGLRCGWLLTDLAFETFRHFELQAALTRLQSSLCEPQHLDCPGQRMGYLGAAAIPLEIMLAAEAHTRGYAPHRYAVCVAGSDTGERGVVLVAKE
jgi:3-oxoacyl-[acyl-carrier-protein] synthase I